MGAAAALFGISFGLLPALLLLSVLAIYDAISVYGTEHMLDLADGVMDLKIPVVLVIPMTLSYSYLEAGSTDDVLEDDREPTRTPPTRAPLTRAPPTGAPPTAVSETTRPPPAVRTPMPTNAIPKPMPRLTPIPSSATPCSSVSATPLSHRFSSPARRTSSRLGRSRFPESR